MGILLAIIPVDLRRQAKLTGGVMFLKSPQLIVANHLCCLTSLAPLVEPIRLFSSLISNLRMQDLQFDETGVDSGNRTSFFITLANVALRLGPLNGVVANYYHMSVALLLGRDRKFTIIS